MAGSVNKVMLIGNVGTDPEVKTMQSGDKVINLSIATSESWKDKATGERRENTQWHRIVIFNQGLVNVCENYVKKGSKLYIEGQLETRSWEQNGEKKYTTEVVLRPYRGELTMLDSRNAGGAGAGASMGGGMSDNSMGGGYNAQPSNGGFGGGSSMGGGQQSSPAPIDELEDEIPF